MKDIKLKNMRKLFLLLPLFAMVLTGCNNERIKTGKTGEVILSLKPDGEFTTILRSSADEVDVNLFGVQITNTTGKVVRSWDTYAEIPDVILLEPDFYTISAQSPGDKVVAWNQPIYAGTQEFDVEAGKVYNIDLVCTLANMKVSVICTDAFKNELEEDYNIKVSTDSGFLEWTKDIVEQGEEIAGFFEPEPMTIYIKGTRKLDGSIVSHYFQVSDVAPRDHHVFTIDVVETGQVSMGDGISVDYTVNNRPVDIQVGDLEENPVEDDYSGNPVLKRVSIANDAVVPTNLGVITFEYDRNIILGDAQIVMGDVEVVSSVEANILSVSFDELNVSTTYTLEIPEGAVINPIDNLSASAHTISFTTEDEVTVDPIIIDVPGMNGCHVITDTNGLVFDLNVTAEYGVSSMIFEVRSPMLIELLAGLGAASSVDIANMSAEEEAFWGGMLKVSSAAVKDATQVTIPLGDLISLLGMQGLSNIEHSFYIKVVDAEGNILDSDVTVMVQK